MPTSVNTARQCLTPEAAQALDEAVSVARRRSHAQTTSLHAISALLSLPSSPLREACARARNSAYTSRIQFKALELCLGVSLDRLPSSPQRVEEPPVSNSFMAAIKRSQASQRRQPENFQLYQQTMSSSCSSSVSMVKVELQNLILSILDDPIVSRVFGESGFRSTDIKVSILRPVHHQLLRYKGPPLFLYNLTTSNFNFRFSGFLDDDDNCKRIIEILIRKQGKRNNPLLVGVSAIDALKIFLEMLQKRKLGAFLPPELSGLGVISVKDEIFNFLNGNCDEGLLKSRLTEVASALKQSIGCGIIVEFGDLKVLIDQSSSADATGCVVQELGSLLEVYGERVWLIGAAERHEIYLEFLNRFPSVEKDWDLQLLPVTSSRPRMAETFPKSSLMESFVPFGGFFSMPSDIRSPLSSANHYGSRCHLCDEKFKQEVTVISKGGFTASVSDQYQSNLPSWLQSSPLCTNGEMDASKAQDDSVVLGAKVAALQKKWDSICQRLHQPYCDMLPKATCKVGSLIPSVVGFQVVEGRKENLKDHSINTTTNASSIESGCDTISKPNSINVRTPSTKLREKHSQIVRSLSSSSVGDEMASPMSGNSVTTDLGLGVNCSPRSRETDTVKSSSSSFPVYHGQSGQKDFKTLYSSLFTRVGRQEEALSVISQAIARCRTKSGSQRGPTRGDIWFSFIGPDRIAKKKIAIALSESLYGHGDIICVDLSCQDFMNGCDLKLRGKNIIDFIADELRRNPLSVVFLENMDMADMLTQHHLSQAVRTGRFSDSHGREVLSSNAILVTTSCSRLLGPALENEAANYQEENLLKVKGGPIQMSTGFDLRDMLVVSHRPKVVQVAVNQRASPPICMNKRKLNERPEIAKRAHRTTSNSLSLDLNLPAEESDTNYESAPDNSNSNAWLEDFVKHVDEKVTFKPFEFDELAEKILDRISCCFEKIIGLECLLEVDSKVMEQILAAAYLLENEKVEDWVERVLGKAFVEAQKKYTLGSNSVMKLITCEATEDQLPGIHLPDRIIMN